MMYLEASDHACPHLREMQMAETRPVEVAPATSCPFGAGRAPSEPIAATAASAGGGWWAFKTEALAMAAQL